MSSERQQHLEVLVGNLLRIGVFTAAAVVMAGAVAYLARHGGERASFGVFRGGASGLRTFAGIWNSVAALRGEGIIQLGLLLLIATPVANVAFAAFAFARLKDVKQVVIALIVLGLLLFSLFGTR